MLLYCSPHYLLLDNIFPHHHTMYSQTSLRVIAHSLFSSGEFIIGRVIKAMNNSWHPDCFCCDICQAVLADVGFVKNAGRLVSHPITVLI